LEWGREGGGCEKGCGHGDGGGEEEREPKSRDLPPVAVHLQRGGMEAAGNGAKGRGRTER
jgi:hypothetical protein